MVSVNDLSVKYLWIIAKEYGIKDRNKDKILLGLKGKDDSEMLLKLSRKHIYELAKKYKVISYQKTSVKIVNELVLL